MAALRGRRQQLHRHRGRHGRDLLADRRRRRPRDRGRGHGDEPRRLQHRGLRADQRPDRGRPAGQHRAAGHHRHAGRRRHPHRQPRDWTGTLPIDYGYQWQQCDPDGTNCTDIPGATGDTYTPGTGDIGHAITVVVTASNSVTDVTVTAPAATAPVVASPPHDTAAPVLSGDVELGGTLTADHGSWSGTPTIDYEYQWQRCDEDGLNCEDIDGATEDTYTLGAADQGHTVVVVVTATNDAGADTSTSAPSALLPAPPANTVVPTISGEEQVGEVLTAENGTWTGTGPLDLRVPVAALRLRRRQLRRHPRRDGRHLHGHRR